MYQGTLLSGKCWQRIFQVYCSIFSITQEKLCWLYANTTVFFIIIGYYTVLFSVKYWVSLDFFFFFKTMDLPYGLSGFNFYLIFEIGSHISQNLIIWARMTLNLLCFCVLDAGIVGLCYGIWFYMVLELEPSTVCIHSESHQHGLHPQSSCGP